MVSGFRPIDSKGSRLAYIVDGDNIKQVPSPRGAISQFTISVKSIIDQWEIVSPDEACHESEVIH